MSLQTILIHKSTVSVFDVVEIFFLTVFNSWSNKNWSVILIWSWTRNGLKMSITMFIKPFNCHCNTFCISRKNWQTMYFILIKNIVCQFPIPIFNWNILIQVTTFFINRFMMVIDILKFFRLKESSIIFFSF